VGAILGEFEDQHDFSTLVLDAWLRTSDETRSAAFLELEGQLAGPRSQYDEAKVLDGSMRLRWNGCNVLLPPC
jgi:hypothetical protein